MGDVAERWRLERILQRRGARKQSAAADVVIAGSPDVVKRRVGESPTGVTGGAIRFAVEQFKAALGGCVDSGIVAVEPTVERRLGGDDGTLERRQGHLGLMHSDVTLTERCVEGVEIIGNSRETFGQGL